VQDGPAPPAPVTGSEAIGVGASSAKLQPGPGAEQRSPNPQQQPAGAGRGSQSLLKPGQAPGSRLRAAGSSQVPPQAVRQMAGSRAVSADHLRSKGQKPLTGHHGASGLAPQPAGEPTAFIEGQALGRAKPARAGAAARIQARAPSSWLARPSAAGRAQSPPGGWSRQRRGRPWSWHQGAETSPRRAFGQGPDGAQHNTRCRRPG